MKVTISEIPAEGLEIALNEAVGSESVNLLRPVRGRLSFILHNAELYVKGRFDTAAEVQCGRCLASYAFDMDVPVDLVYYPSTSSAGHDNLELHSDELDVSYYSGDEIRTEDILEEQILLNLPMKPLCAPECRGICPSCGADLNIRECACRTDSKENVFSVLKKLKDDKE